MSIIKVTFLNTIITTLIFSIYWKFSANFQQGNYAFLTELIQNETKLNPQMITVTQNNYYLLNNNVAQYSSYLIFVTSENYRIETLIVLNNNGLRYVDSNYNVIENYICVLKYIKNIDFQEIIELGITKSSLLAYNKTKKLIFNLDLNKFQTFLKDPEVFDVNKIVVAVIINKDFNKTISMDEFIESIESHGKLPKHLQLPYDSILFQQPTIINAHEPRIPAVGLCIHNTWTISSESVIIDWIKLQLSFGIAEIRFYDSTKLKNLTKIVTEKFGNENSRLTILPYEKFEILENYVESLFNGILTKTIPTKLKIILLKRQEDIFSRGLLTSADHITLNDCFTNFRLKYEFIAHYDLYELLLPRVLDNNQFFENKKAYTCSKSSSAVCSTNPFKFSSFRNNHLYEYIKSLIENESNGRNIDKLSSINFHRTLTFKPKEEIEIKLINDLKNIIDNSLKNSIKFPTEVFVQTNHLRKYGQKFIIKKEDIDYVIFLHKTYKRFFACVDDQYLRSIKSGFNSSFVRYLYYHQKEQDYKPKKVYYYKNVYSVFTHWPVDFENDTWELMPSPNSGHLVHHFRDKLEIKNINFTESIRNIGFDFEYTFFMLKNFTNFCVI
jgi:hypothetical protein